MYVCNFCKIYNFVRYISKKKKKIVNMLVIGMLNFNFMIMLKKFCNTKFPQSSLLTRLLDFVGRHDVR